MWLDIHIYHHQVPDPFVKDALSTLLERTKNMRVALENARREVTEIGAVVDSAVVLIEGIAAELATIKTDPAAIQALADELDAKATVLATAVAANTIAEDEPPVEPPVEPPL